MITFLSVAPAVGKDESTVCVWRWARSSQIARVWDGITHAVQTGRGYLKCREAGRPPVPVRGALLSGIHAKHFISLDGL